MPRAGLSRAAVVDAALAVVDDGGPGALTLAAVAARTGVAAPSLYKHVRSLAELQRLLAARGYDEIADALTDAVLGRSGEDALRALVRQYLTFAVERPRRYALMPQAPDPDPAVAAAGERVVGVCFAVLKGCGFAGADLVHATRVLRAALHGFAVLQTGGAFRLADDIGATGERLVLTLVEGLARWPR